MGYTDMNEITLTKVYDPLNRKDQDIIKYQYVNETISDLIDAQGNYIKSDLLKFEVSVNGVIVPKEEYEITRLVPGSHVTIIPILEGFWKSVKSIVRTVALVALAVAAAVVLAPLAEAILFSTAINSVWAAYAIAAVTVAAVTVAGSALINAVLPVSQDQPDASSLGYSGITQSNSYSWNPHNTQQQGIAIPNYYGTCLVQTSNVIGAYREMIGTDVYLNILFSFGSGPISPPYDFKLNDQDISKFDNVEVETRLGYLNQSTINRFGDTRVEYSVSRLVEYNSPVLYETIGSDFDALEVEIAFPNGLFYYSDTGKMENYTVRYSLEYRRLGDSDWIPLAKTPYTYTVSAAGYWSVGSMQVVSMPSWINFGITTGFFSLVGPSQMWIEAFNGGTDPNAHYEGETVDFFGTTVTYKWITTEYKQVTGYYNYADSTSNSRDPIYITYRAENLTEGNYEIRATKLTEDKTDTRYGDEFYLLAAREIINDDFTYPGEALVGLRALATDQISGSISFSCMTNGKYIRVRKNGVWTSEASSNPAWIAFDILTNPILDNDLIPVEYRNYDPSRIDIDKFEEWAEYCDDLVPDGNGGTEKRLTYNGIIDAQMSLWDHAIAVSKIGRGTPYWKGNILTVSVDMPSSPVALVTVGNIGLDSFTETFLAMESRAGSIECEFLNIESGYNRDKFTVVNPDAPSEWGVATLTLQGVVKPSEIYRHCRYYLSTTQNLTRIVDIIMDLDAIAFTIGDVINVQHDVPLWGNGGRIVSATSNTVTLDKPVLIESGNSYAIMIRLKDNSLVQRFVVNPAGEHTVLNVSTDFSNIPDQFDPYAFGKQDIFVKPMRVISIEPSSDLMRKIYLTDYNDSIYESDYLEPVIPTTNYTDGVVEQITGLTISERMEKFLGGNVITYIDIKWDKQSYLVRYVELQIYKSGKMENLGITASVGMTVEVPDGENIIIYARSIPWIGKPQDWIYASKLSYSVIGKTAPPSDVSVLFASPTSTGGLLLSWYAISDIDVLEYVVKYSPLLSGASWDTSQEITRNTGTSITIPSALDGTYMVKAVDTGMRESINAAYTATSIPSLFGYNAIASINDAPEWVGEKDGVFTENNVIRLNTAGDFNEITDFDSVLSIDQYGGILPYGYYYLSEYVELDSIQTCRCAAKILFYGVDNEDLFDNILDFNAKMDIDGDATNGLDVKSQISISQDLTNWSDWYDFVSGDYTAIGYRFRLRLSSNDIANYPAVTSFEATVDMADRIERGKGVVVDSSGSSIAFSTQYKAPPVVRTTIIGAESGDTEIITNVSEHGFDILILNDGIGVERTIDWQSIGY